MTDWIQHTWLQHLSSFFISFFILFLYIYFYHASFRSARQRHVKHNKIQSSKDAVEWKRRVEPVKIKAKVNMQSAGIPRSCRERLHIWSYLPDGKSKNGNAIHYTAHWVTKKKQILLLRMECTLVLVSVILCCVHPTRAWIKLRDNLVFQFLCSQTNKFRPTRLRWLAEVTHLMF